VFETLIKLDFAVCNHRYCQIPLHLFYDAPVTCCLEIQWEKDDFWHVGDRSSSSPLKFARCLTLLYITSVSYSIVFAVLDYRLKRLLLTDALHFPDFLSLSFSSVAFVTFSGAYFLLGLLFQIVKNSKLYPTVALIYLA